MIVLIFYNDPLSFFKSNFIGLYNFQSVLFESMFIALILFFWLLYVHSISVSTFLAISPTNFFAPKMLISAVFFIHTIIYKTNTI